MSKLLQFKEWLEIEDASKYLSIVFGESLSTADVLRLALDGHLQLSVYFVNQAKARRGIKLSYANAEKFSSKDFNDDLPHTELVCGLKLYNEETGLINEVVQFEERIFTIDGVWDLTMLGGERLDVEHQYQMLTNGVEVTLVNFDGAYISTKDGEIFELQARFDDEDIKTKISRKFNDPENYYPAGGLPDDSVFVVRTTALANFEKNFNKPKQLQEVESMPLADIDRAHVSNNLAILNQAATRFWANADRKDNTTHPINSTVTTWLIQRGYSATLADKGATIIRPEWATTGRKADK